MLPDGYMGQPTGFLRRLPQPGFGAGVGEDVPPFGGADIAGHRNHRYTGDQAAGYRQHGGRGGLGQHGHPLRATDPFGHRRRGADEVASAERGAVDAHRVIDVGPVGDGRGVQRGQQHVSEATRTGSAYLAEWIRSSASRPARCTATTG